MEAWKAELFGEHGTLNDKADRSLGLMETTPVASRTTHFDVVIVGAGLSGIGAAHYLQTECPWADY
ncbi:MAG: hypothetical protein ACLP7F_14815, partial [Acidimicrobiales bacterium]